MMPLSFRGYLEFYVKYLAGGRTLALKELVAFAEKEPRLNEPLLLWVVKTGRQERFCKLLGQGDRLRHDLQVLVSLELSNGLETALAAGDSRLSSDYHKVWHSYAARSNASKRDAELKLKARKQALALEAAKTVTRYRMAKDLGLNPGNLHAFLAQGNPSKLSLNRVFDLLHYLEAA